MDSPLWVRNLFQSIDQRDAHTFSEFLAEDGVFRYGSQPAVAGREAVRDYVAGFFSGLSGVRHELTGFWWGQENKVCFVQGNVIYHLANDAQVTVPFLNLLRMRDAAIVEYLVYTDPTPLSQPA
jgi:ketosteroid isomerase-like protein